ncbi:S-layer homology domain-containing protein [Rossellomorea vietnamensis]|uniref:S-layer homology domain-containing protein n=1 Tax=Rossellomorea vietnamensis TaxID=218284 RepID=A0A5D4KFN6_9BACI|nr:S-layer homology domain-containing protein [Rossellomorea vietnamensis]TYR76012.1 S-layer homology domain-containing protein [Rossellomorea vietnamensis]
MAYQPKSRRKFLATSLTAAMVASAVAPTAGFAAGFPDVSEDHIYYNVINDLVAADVVAGMPDGTFDLGGKVTRAQAALMVSKILGLGTDAPATPFSDVKEGVWYTDAINALYAEGYIKGVDENSFAPNQEITRAQFAQLIVEAYGIASEDVDLPFSDLKEGAWYEEAIKTLYATGLITGKTPTTFAPNESIKRGDFAWLLANTDYKFGDTLPKPVLDVTEQYTLELTTNVEDDTILANGADNMVIKAQIIDEETGLVDTNADDIVIAFSSTYGNLANTRVTVQDGEATVTLTSEFSQQAIESKVDAQIIEAGDDYKELIGKVVGSKKVQFVPTLEEINPEIKAALTNAESNQADRVTLYFNKAVTLDEFVEVKDGKLQVDAAGNAVLKEDNIIEVVQDGDTKAIRGFKAVAGNPNALEVILEKSNVLDDNKKVDVTMNMPSNVGTQTTKDSFILTDARKPEATSAEATSLRNVVVEFSESISKANFKLDGGLLGIEAYAFGEFDQVTGVDNRNKVTIKTKDYMTAGTHSVQLSSIYDFAGLTDSKNISTTQTLDFNVAEDKTVPTAAVSVESPEQFRLQFNKSVEDFDLSDLALQKFVKGTNGVADQWVNVSDSSLNSYYPGGAPTLSLDKVNGSEYVVELTSDWTEIYNTSVSKKNYYNDQYRLVLAKDAVTNLDNGLKNAKLELNLNYDGSVLNTADTKSPKIDDFGTTTKADHYNVFMSEPVKLPGKDAKDTASQIQGEEIPNPIIEFLGKDKNGDAITVKGKVVGYAETDGSDDTFEVAPAVGTDSLQALVDAGASQDWTLVVRSISDDIGNTAASLTHDFKIKPSVVTTPEEVFYVKKGNYNGVSGYTNFGDEDTIVLDFTSAVQFTGSVANAVNVANYTLDGENLPKGTSIELADSDSNAKNGYDVVVINLPDGTLTEDEGKTNVINISKSLLSANDVALTGEHEIQFTPVEGDMPVIGTPVVDYVTNLVGTKAPFSGTYLYGVTGDVKSGVASITVTIGTKSFDATISGGKFTLEKAADDNVTSATVVAKDAAGMTIDTDTVSFN